MSESNKPQSGVESILRAVERLQANVLAGHRDSIEINPENVRPIDELDIEFGTLHNSRADNELDD